MSTDTGAPRFRVALYSPDRARVYDGRIREADGVGGGITARLSLVEALAALGHAVTAYVHCAAPLTHRGVSYVPLDAASSIDCDIFIAISTGGALTFAPLRGVSVRAALRILWVQGVPQPADIEAVAADHVYVASDFLRGVCQTRWRVPPQKLFVCYNGIHQEYFREAERDAPVRDPFAMAFIGPPEKGLDACTRVLQRLRQHDDRFHLDVFGGAELWGGSTGPAPTAPGVTFKGLRGQRQLAHALFHYEYALAIQDIAEGFGMAVQEAKRAGAVVIASSVGAFGELIRHGADGYLVPPPAGSPTAEHAAADLIRQLAADPLRRGRIRQRAMATPWSWELAARTWTAHWRQTLRAPDQTAAAGPTIDLPDGRHRTSDGAYFPSVYPLSPLPDRLGVPEPTRVLIGGYYGYGNLGDEAILSVALAQLQSARADLLPIVASADPADTTRRHDVSAIDERNVAALARAVGECEAVVLGGGGLFHDTHGADESTFMTSKHGGLPQCAGYAALARLCGKPLVVLGAGVGPLDSDTGRRLTRVVFEQAVAASVRDDDSRACLDAVGAVTDRTVVTADPAFLLPSATTDEARHLLRAMGVSGAGGLVCVAVRHWDIGADPARWEPAVAAALDRLIVERDVSVVFVPFQANLAIADDDAAVAERIRRLMTGGDRAAIAESALSPSVMQALFGCSQAVLAMRLHAVILAANAGTPFVALRYDEKVGHTLRRLGLPDEGLDLPGVSAERLAARLAAAIDEPARFRAAFSATLPGLRDAARQCVPLALDAIARPRSEPLPASDEWRALLDRARAALASAALASSRPRRPASQLMAAAGRALVPAPWRRPLREAWRGRFMSRAALAFDHFRRARRQICGADVGGLRAPGVTGLVSIILPVYNGEPLLREAIDSILAQTCRSFELIVVDDGSADRSAVTADDYARRDARVRVLHRPHERLPAALAAGFREARGEFLTWASADNRLKPDALERLAACLRRHPHWDVVYANLDLIGEDGRPLRGSPHFRSYQRPHGSEHVHLPLSTDELNVRENNFIGAGFLYRRRVALLLGDYSRFRFGLEDYDFWMRANALLTLRHADFDEPVVEYRFHEGSLTSRSAELGLPAARTRLMVFDHFRRDAALWPLVWVIDGRASARSRALERRIREAGHVIHDGAYPLDARPDPWVPVVYVSTDSQPEAGASRVPAAVLRVLWSDAETLPSEVSGAWDLCVATGSATPTPLARTDQGWLVAPDVDHLFHAIDIRTRSLIAAQVEALAESPPDPTLTASVVICANRTVATLDAAVTAAVQQDFPAGAFEVLVVNNRPGDAGLDAAMRRLPASVRIVPCPIPGISAARNAGLGAARGRYVCYLDDDAVAEPQWLARLCGAFDAHPHTGVIGGPILLTPPSPAPAALVPGWESYWSHFAPAYGSFTDVDDWPAFPWGANWAARRSVLYQIGGFRLAFGRRGNDYLGGEELVAAALAQRLGHRIGIEPGAIVHHHVDPTRFTDAHVRDTQRARHLVAQAAARDQLAPHPPGVPRSLARLLLHHVDPRVRSWPHTARDVAFRKAAQWRALAADLEDLRRRWRGPEREDR